MQLAGGFQEAATSTISIERVEELTSSREKISSNGGPFFWFAGGSLVAELGLFERGREADIRIRTAPQFQPTELSPLQAIEAEAPAPAL